MRIIVTLCVILGVACRGLAEKPSWFLQFWERQLSTDPMPTEIAGTTNAPITDMPTGDTDVEEDDFEDLEELFMFPGSDYFYQMIQRYCLSDMALKQMDISVTFKFPGWNSGEIRKFFNVFREFRDPEGMSLLATRIIINKVFEQRMKCPASIINTGIARMMLAWKNEMPINDTTPMLTIFKDTAIAIDPEFTNFADDIAQQAVDLLHGSMFNDTMMFLMAFGMKDIAFTSHYMYFGLKNFFEDMAKSSDKSNKGVLMQRLNDTIVGSMWNLSCPSYEETADTQRRMLEKFIDQFEALETTKICEHLDDFLHDYARTWMDGYEPIYKSDELEPVCEWIHGWLQDVVDVLENYEMKLYTMEMSLLEETMHAFLKPYEWSVVKKAATVLGFS